MGSHESTEAPTITIRYLPKYVPAGEAEIPTRRAHTKLNDFAAARQTVSSFDPSDDWTKLGSISEDTSVYADKKIGYIEQFTEVYKNTSETSQTPTITMLYSTAIHSLPTTTAGVTTLIIWKPNRANQLCRQHVHAAHAE